MVEVPDTDDVVGSLADSGKAAAGALVGMNLGNQVSGGSNIGSLAGGVAGALATGKSAENKAAATFVMLQGLPSVLDGSGIMGATSSQNTSQNMTGAAPTGGI